MRCLYNPNIYGDAALGGPSSFYGFINALEDTSEEKLVTVSRTVGGFEAMSAMVEGSLSMIHIQKRHDDNSLLKTKISHFQCPFSHLQGALPGLIPPNEARRVHENTALNVRNSRKLVVSNPAPRFW